jgi:hypothetical protein
MGFVKPNSMIDAAICAICSGECVRAFLAYGTNRSIGQISMRRAIAGAKEEVMLSRNRNRTATA